MDERTVRDAVEQGGSARAAAKLLNKSYTSLQWWLATKGYKVVKTATIVPIERPAPVKSGEVLP